MTDGYVKIDLPGEAYPPTGRLLAEAQPVGSLPLLQIFDCVEYLIALKRHRDGRVEHDRIWISDDQFDGRCQPVSPLPEREIRDDLRRFFAGDPRADALVRETALRS